MADLTERTIALSQAEERLRQERETFDQLKLKDDRTFRLRMAMGWIATVMLPAIAVSSMGVLYFHEKFTDATVTAASATLFVEVIACVVGIWRNFAGSTPEMLGPVTKESSPAELN